MSKPLAVPTIHLNGTSKESFRKDLGNAHESIRNAIDALLAMAPHGRDYYVQGPDAYGVARREHEARIEKLSSVRDEVLAIWNAIEEQGK